MKKFFMGLIVGALLMFSSQIYAASTKLLGNEVDKVMNVKLDDKTIGQAAVIDGTSYLPVRTLADEFNLKVDVSASEIKLSNPSSEENAQKAAEQQANMDQLTTLNDKKNKITSDIKSANDAIASDKDVIARNEKTKSESESKYQKYSADETIAESQKTVALNTFKHQIDIANNNIDKLNQRIAENQAKIAQYEADLTEVNAQIAALEVK